MGMHSCCFVLCLVLKLFWLNEQWYVSGGRKADVWHGFRCIPTLHLVVATNTKCVGVSLLWLRFCSPCLEIFFCSFVFSGGRGPVNPKGLRFYKNLLDELKSHGKIVLPIIIGKTINCVLIRNNMNWVCYCSLAWNVSAGIEPHVTLYHDDLPQTLEDEYGGWFDRKIM